MMAVQLKNLSFRYGANLPYIIKNINLTINYGEITLLTGLSGGGKSTILYLINKIIPDVIDGEISGDIFINGHNTIEDNIASLARQVGCIIQNPDQQIINAKCRDELIFGQENCGFTHAKIKANLAKYSQLFQIDLNANTYYLSGGQKEHLLLASTLAMEQKILLLDEPLANLDQASIRLLLHNLLKLKNQGYAILIAEHRLTYLKEIVDKCYLLDKQKLTLNAAFMPNNIKTPHVPLWQGKSELISMKSVSKEFGKKCFLHNISLTINEGERVLLLGDNGCGKTTLLQLMGKLITPTSGTITQKIIPKLKTKQKGNKAWFRMVGYIFQNPNYQLFMPSVKDELTYGAVDKEYLAYLITNLNLTPLLNLHPQALSEGQKRRLSVAAILASKPQVLLLDEPTVGQDDLHLTQIITVLNDYYRRFKPTIVAITHDYRFAKALADKVVLVNKDAPLRVGGKDLLIEYFTK